MKLLLFLAFLCSLLVSCQEPAPEVEAAPKNLGPAQIVVLCAEKEYKTAETLPVFIKVNLSDYDVTYVDADAGKKRFSEGLEKLNDADLLIVSVRRFTPESDQMKLIRDYVQSGKPVLGIRTASHAFSLRGGKKPSVGREVWDSWDKDVFGGNYKGHTKDAGSVLAQADTAEHDILEGVTRQPFSTGGTLYQVLPLSSGAKVLMLGISSGVNPEPVAWTYQNTFGGRSFYTSLGHPADFENPEFQQMMVNAIKWCLNR